MEIDTTRLIKDADRDGIDKLVVGALIHTDTHVLILRRSATDDFLPGIEELPSGGVETGEELLEALARELAEEVGRTSPLQLSPEFAATFDYTTGSGRTARQITFALPHDGAPITLSDEHTAHRWIHPSEAHDSDLTPQSRGIVDQWVRLPGPDATSRQVRDRDL